LKGKEKSLTYRIYSTNIYPRSQQFFLKNNILLGEFEEPSRTPFYMRFNEKT